MSGDLRTAIVVGTCIVATVAILFGAGREPAKAPPKTAAPRVMSLNDKCAMHSKVAEVPTKYVAGVGCYEKKFHRWELVQFPED